MRVLGAALLLLGAAVPLAAASAQTTPSQATPAEKGQARAAIEAAARTELADKQVPSIAIALVDRNGVIWSSGWGMGGATVTSYG